MIERRYGIEIIYGTRVEDKNGKTLGTVNNIVHDTWTGEIRKFSVSEEKGDTVLFYSPEDVSESNNDLIKLKIAFGEANLSIQYGAKVFDKNNKLLGTVDYPVSNSLTGEVEKFKVKAEPADEALVFSLEDVDKISPDEVKLKIAFD